VQQAERLAGNQVVEPAHSGDIAARPVEAGDVALLDRVAARREHDRNGLGPCHGSQYRRATSRRGDHGHLATDQIGRKSRQSVVLIFRETVFDCYVAAIDIASFTQTTAERRLEIRPITLP
jgi:hypothetical protein